MKRLIAFLVIMVAFVTTSSVSINKKEPVTIFDADVTAREFNEMCVKENVPMELNEWLWVKAYIEYEKHLDQWIYIKGNDADSLFVLTRDKNQKLHLNIQIRDNK